MLQKFEINGVHASIDEQLRDLVNKKLGRLDRYMSKHSRQSAHGEVYLKEAKAKDKSSYTCELTLYMPHQTIVIKEKAFSLRAAVDAVESRAKIQLKKYKDTHSSAKFQRHLMARFKRQS